MATGKLFRRRTGKRDRPMAFEAVFVNATPGERNKIMPKLMAYCMALTNEQNGSRSANFPNKEDGFIAFPPSHAVRR
jgi:hypothetical protein